MSKSRRNGMLGVGGQRSNVPRRALRGGRAQASGNGNDPAAQKKELLRKMRERTERRATPQEPAPENGTSEKGAGSGLDE